MVLRKKDSRVLTVLSTILGHFDVKGCLTHYSVIAKDISELKTKKLRLQESHENLKVTQAQLVQSGN